MKKEMDKIEIGKRIHAVMHGERIRETPGYRTLERLLGREGATDIAFEIFGEQLEAHLHNMYYSYDLARKAGINIERAIRRISETADDISELVETILEEDRKTFDFAESYEKVQRHKK